MTLTGLLYKGLFWYIYGQGTAKHIYECQSQ